MRVYLIGYMASGKSNLGRLLAANLGYKFIDLDYLFEERYRISVLDFFEKYDEGAFRTIERSLLLETTVIEDVIVSTGGGTPCSFDNMDVIKNSGVSIYLFWNVPALVRRLALVKRKRPLLKNIRPEEMEEKVTSHLTQREFYYNQADYKVNGEDVDVASLADMVKNHERPG